MPLGKGLNSLIPNATGRRRVQRRTGDEKSGRIWYIPLSEIVPNSEQPRKEFKHKDLEDLVASIKAHGVLQPITVTECDDGGYELIAGERRLRASDIAGLATVPAIVRPATAKEKLELALIENIQRQDLNPIEEAFAFQRLVEEFDMTQEQVGKAVGKSRPVITNTIRLLQLPEQIQKGLIEGTISTGKAKVILGLKKEEDQLATYMHMVNEGGTVRDVEKVVSKKGAASRKGSVRRDPNLTANESRLEEALGTKVRISQRGERGTITIDYFSLDERRRLIDTITD